MTVEGLKRSEGFERTESEFNYEVYPVRQFQDNSTIHSEQPNDSLNTDEKNCINETMLHTIVFCCGFLFFPIFFGSILFYSVTSYSKITRYPISFLFTIINTILGLVCTVLFIFILASMSSDPY